MYQIYLFIQQIDENEYKQNLMSVRNFQINNFGSIIKIVNAKRSMKTNKQIVVCMSGFASDPNMQSYLKMLQQIGCKYAEQLSLDDDYLIINHTCTQKYKIAELQKSSTQCISLQWLKDSIKNKKALAVQKYKIKKIFYGTRVVLQGFEDKKMQDKVIDILKNNGAQQVKVGVQGMLPQQLYEKYQVIIVPNAKVYRKLQAKIAQFLMIPFVTPEWLEQSLKNKKCKYPNDYALNYQNIVTRYFDDYHNTRRLNKKLQSFMELQFLSPQGSAILTDDNTKQQLIIYLDSNSIEPSFLQLLMKLICVSGGIYLNSYGPVVTHILVGPVQQNQYLKFMSYGDYTSILRVQWLIDSILFGQKLPEIDFKVRSFKQQLVRSTSQLQIKQVYAQRNQHSFNFAHSYHELNTINLTASLSFLPVDSTKKINKHTLVPDPLNAKVIPVTKTKITKLDLFKRRLFYLQKSQRKQVSMQSIFTKIKQYGGYAVSENYLPQIKNTKLYIVLKDSDKNLQHLQQISKIVSKNGVTLVVVSIRWIEQCVKKSQYIDYNAENYFIFKPFMFDVPVRQLMSMKIELLGFDQILKRRYKQLLIALGTNKVSPNINEITHCLCGTNYQSDARYNLIITTKQNDRQKQKQKQKQKPTVSKQSSAVKLTSPTNFIKFIKSEWLMDIVNKKGKVNIDEYVIEVEKYQ